MHDDSPLFSFHAPLSPPQSVFGPKAKRKRGERKKKQKERERASWPGSSLSLSSFSALLGRSRGEKGATHRKDRVRDLSLSYVKCTCGAFALASKSYLLHFLRRILRNVTILLNQHFTSTKQCTQLNTDSVISSSIPYISKAVLHIHIILQLLLPWGGNLRDE